MGKYSILDVWHNMIEEKEWKFLCKIWNKIASKDVKIEDLCKVQQYNGIEKIFNKIEGFKHD